MVSEGDLLNQIEFLSLASIALFHFSSAWRRLRMVKGLWLTALVLYVFWAAFTVSWSIDPFLSARRLALFAVELVAWVGIGAGYYGGEHGPVRLCRDLRQACLVLIVLALPVIGPEMTPSNLLNPYWESVIRLTTNDVIEGSVFGLLACLAPAIYRRSFNAAKLRIFVPPAVFILLFLLITKGRSAIAMTLLVLGFTATRLVRNVSARLGSRFVLALMLILVVTNFSTSALEGTAIGEYLARGNNTKTLEGLNGRTQLWEYILSDINLRPLQGYGFGAYWTAERMDLVWSRFRWHAPLAHNGYLDETIQTGLIGMGLMLLFLAAVLAKIHKLSRRYPAATIGLSWIALFLLLNLTDSYFQNFRRLAVVSTMLMSFSCLGVSEIQSRRNTEPIRPENEGYDEMPPQNPESIPNRPSRSYA